MSVPRQSPSAGRGGVAGGRRAGSGDGRRAGRTDGEADGPPVPVDPRERARAICLRLLAVRPRTRVELTTALRRRDIPDDVAEAVLDRFGEVGMIDDTAFAEAWVTSRHHGRGLARRALGHELRRRGVDGATVRDALGQLDPATEEQTARRLVERKLRSIGGGNPQALLRTLGGMLARKGYPAGLAFRVIRDVLAQHPQTASFLETADVDLDALSSHAAEVDDADGFPSERYVPDT